MAVAAGVELVGRERELARLEEFVGGVGYGAAAAVLHGDAGIGKTVLWRAAVEAAERGGVRVLATRCAEAEMPLALGGLGDLLDAALPEIEDELTEPQRRALGVVIGVEPSSDHAPDPIALPRAFVACLRALADRSPVLVAIDDAQWLDPSSQRILAFAARRLGSARVGVLATQRGDSCDPLDLRAAFAERVVQIHLGPLTVGALHHLIRKRLEVRIPRPTVARVHAASGGNPMFALEFAQVAASAGGPLPVPSSLEELVRERVARLPQAVLPLLAAVAAVERPTVRLLETVVDDAGVLLDAAAAAGAVTLDADGVVRFTHPLLASAAYAAIPPVARARLHAVLADASEEPEERARHVALATAEPDARVARVLGAAAVRARARGAPDAAATLARHAVRLTPLEDAAAREERVLAEAEYLMDSGQMAAAGALLDELLETEIAGPRRAWALLLASIIEPGLERFRQLVGEALKHTADDRALRIRALLALGTDPLARGDLSSAEVIVREALKIAEELADPVLLSAALTAVGHVSELAGRPQPALMERAVELAGANPPIKGFMTPRIALAQLRLSEGALGEARELLEMELEAARRWADENLMLRLVRLLAELEWQAGKWDRADRLIEEHRQLVFDGEDRSAEILMSWQEALLAASRGRVEDARRLALEAVRSAEDVQLPWLAARGRWTLAFLALSLEKPAEAWEVLRDGGGLPERLDARSIWIVADAVEAAVAVGRLDEARALVAALDEQARDGEHVWATAAALRCQALLLLAEGESETALAEAQKAASRFEAAGFPLDCGRSFLVAGEALRRLGERRRAAETLERAKAIFAELGAPLWIARADSELRRASPRPRHDDGLTAAERRVAALVAAGRTNREVAAQLFTTVGTVEVHLTRIYRKLGLRSRTELARLVAEGALDLEDGWRVEGFPETRVIE